MPPHHALTYILLLATPPLATANQIETQIEELVITASFHPTPAHQMPTSISLLDSAQIRRRAADHLDQLLNLAPNVNHATGASRGRFIQIRGIGEREEFQEPVNYSVGVLIDGIDLTGLPTAATTLDIHQIEILRGPQGTLHGANALAGLINMVSAPPGPDTPGYLEANLGTAKDLTHSRTLKGATGGELNPKTPYRLATQTTRSDGFIKNHHLARDDTNNIDETTARARLAHAATPNLDLGLTLFHANIDNGYDIFNFDNTRQTRTNHPGHDRQKTQALALTADWHRTPTQTLELRLSGAASDLEYGYDEDWSNPQLCQLDPCPRGDFGYHSTTDNYARDNRTLTLDTRLKTTPSDHTRTTIGTYHRRQQIDLTRTTTATSPFTSRHQDTRHALYGELAQDLRPQLTLTAGARLESRHATYADSAPFQFTTRENLWGGKLALSHRPTAQTLLYAALSRGYKPGGANANPDLPPPFRHYRTETTLNTELGIKTQHPNFQAQLTAFHQRRRNIQAKSAIVDCAPAGGPCTFTEYLTNAATATHRGIEAQLTWHPNARTSLATALGLLHTAFGPGYTNFQHIAADNQTATGIDMTGRPLPHAPRYQFTAALDRQLTPALRLHLDLEGKDRFLFSNDHDHRSTRYTLLNARLSYQPPQNPNWSAALWGKNLTNKTYQTRGFGTFGNDPRNGYACCGPYYQLADPRTLGLNIRHQF